METHDEQPTTPPEEPETTETPPAAETPPTTETPPTGGSPPRLYRSSSGRVLAGVCGGLGRYLGIDPVICRVVAVALVFFGGAGVLLYGAAWLLVPSDDGGPGAPVRGRMATLVGAGVLALAVAILFSFHGGWGWGPGLGLGTLVVLGLVGLGVWWLASGDRPPIAGGDVLRRVGIGLALLAACGVLAIGGAWATAAGGGTAVAIAVIAAGVALAAGAFLGRVRWLILPALALALPASAVAAADLDVRGGVGEREYRPLTASDVRDHYRIGVGRLAIDLRDADLSPGDHRLRIRVGIGQALLIVPPDVCVSSRAHVEAGEARVFDRHSDGVDVDWEDVRTAPAGTPRLVVDGDVGLGTFEVHHQDPDFGPDDDGLGNEACAGGRNG